MNALACRFEGYRCSHPTLFRSEYKRTNRTKQTKILRCFPHCCPEHLNRSYCGSSLCVRVDCSGQQTTASSLLLFARFDQAQTKFLAINEEVDVEEVTSSIQTEQTPKGKWIEGTVKPDESTDQSCLFLVNPGARWYYEWESAATKSQRFTKHVLRAYIFQRVSESRLRVVGLASSSEFMVMSYRRAPIEVRAEREALQALRAAASVQQPLVVGAGGPTAIRATVNYAVPPFHTHRLQQLHGREDGAWRERKVWECRHPDTMVSAKQLAMLYHFVHFVDASGFHTCLEKWQQHATGHSGAMSWHFLGVPRPHSTSRSGNLPDGPESDSFSQLVHTCANLAGWLALDHNNLDLYRRFLGSYSVSLLDQDRVRYGYVEAVKLISELIDRFTSWNKDPSVPSLNKLSEEIMAVVFQYDHLKPLRHKLMEILSTTSMFGMHEFVAQLRAQFIDQQRHSLSIQRMESRKRADETSVFDGTWTFNGDQSSVSPIRGTATLSASLGSMLTFMRELARVSIRSTDAQTLEICSVWNASGLSSESGDVDTRAGMALVLDSCPRIFRNFPSGISSSISFGAYSYGDYRGKVMSVNHFVLEISSWPVDRSSELPALRWKFQVRVQEDTDRRAPTGSKCDVLLVDAVVEEGFWGTDSRNEAPDFVAMSFDQKLQSMKTWYPMYEVSAVYDCVRK